ncbi:MAG: hypothetical protein ACOC5T_07175 [Elusimicrobiota bacterium]
MISYRGIQQTRYEEEINRNIGNFVELLKQINEEGNRSQATIDMDFRSDLFCALEYFKLGDVENYIIEYKYSWKDEKEIVIVNDPLINILTVDGNPIVLKEGKYTLELTNILSSENTNSYVLVSLIS